MCCACVLYVLCSEEEKKKKKTIADDVRCLQINEYELQPIKLCHGSKAFSLRHSKCNFQLRATTTVQQQQWLLLRKLAA